ncbi:MAG: hypothetical protein SGJ18_09925 [Pseudomonadota bacterium]|nr:hypothetical protein [Pseudomonadota bacterium]
MNQGLNLVIFLWPFLILILACLFHGRQNSKKAWTGGPISWPKSIWLFYTVLTWFILPFFFLFHTDLPDNFRYVLVGHLVSWWTRGILELFMIYRWYNWSPRYGITHDTLHIILFVVLGWQSGFWGEFSLENNFNSVCYSYALVIIFSTIFEGVFAYLFLKTRSQNEEKDNVYFASNDPKWIFINRLTTFVAAVVLLQLFIQSAWIFEIYF